MIAIFKRLTGNHHWQNSASGFLAIAFLMYTTASHAWVLPLTADSPRLFLHVGEGAVSGNSGTLDGNPGRSGRVNTVKVKVPAEKLGNGEALAMSTDSTQSTSLYGDSSTACSSVGTQVIVGAGYRRNGNAVGSRGAELAVRTESNLTNANGDIIPISEISWTVASAPPDNTSRIRSGAFTSTAQTLATIRANEYQENCFSFFYANEAVRAAGKYNGSVVYTLTAP